MIKQLKIENFTAFGNIIADFVQGINIFIGANGTGKTHILKILYSVCSTSDRKNIEKCLSDIFLPSQQAKYPLAQLLRKGSTCAYFSITYNDDKTEYIEINQHGNIGNPFAFTKKIHSVYVPVREMLANAPGFRSLYSLREIHFEGVYTDIIDRAFLPYLKKNDASQHRLLNLIKENIDEYVKSPKSGYFSSLTC